MDVIKAVLQETILKVERTITEERLTRLRRDCEQDAKRLDLVRTTPLFEIVRLFLVSNVQRSIYDPILYQHCERLYAKVKRSSDRFYKETVTVVIDEVMRTHGLDPSRVLGNGIKTM